MKAAAGFILILTALSLSLEIKAENSKMSNAGNCFSESNLSIVHSYIKTQISKGNKPFYEFEGYELYAEENLVIALKDKGYTLARISKENGICSLAVYRKNNERIVKRTGEIFCSILKTANENN